MMKNNSKPPSLLQSLLSIALFIWIYTALPDCSQPDQPLAAHNITYQTKGTLHLLAHDDNLTESQCLALIENYRYNVTNQIAVYKKSPLFKSEQPWCVLNKLNPNNNQLFFNKTLFPDQATPSNP